ncbi:MULTISPECIES: universal stress protein [Niastella]|uniref:Universal stress protein n=1 Tax=Niastella soli TaxID=2821487 RepID=A0ABS3YVZ7_9BACT|nr:universal stress protein [Niastella soli]MBO9201580.1 universal stress protein [Niastella soli]
MKKIIAVIDGLKYSDSSTEYAVHIAKQTGSHLVGVFLDDFTYHSYKIYELVDGRGFVNEEKMARLQKSDEQAREEATQQFSKACEEAGVNYAVHHDRNIAIHELLHESIFADLLVIESKETLTHYEEKLPTRFIRDLLSEVQCPVLVVPKKFTPFEKAVLLYDGEAASVYAIKAFSYLFAGLPELKVEVVSVKAIEDTLHVPDNHLMKEFMKRHFPKAVFTVLRGEAENRIVSDLKNNKEQLMVVLGAYNRGMVSRWFRHSMADILMEELNKPLFIPHHS